MALFTRNRDLAVQSFILKLVNNNCAELNGMLEGPRLERRVNLTIVVAVVPIKDKKPVINEAFTAVTKEFANTGLSLVLDEPLGLDEVVLGFRWESAMSWARARAKHLSPMGGGFYQLGVRMLDMVPTSDYPELKSLNV